MGGRMAQLSCYVAHKRAGAADRDLAYLGRSAGAAPASSNRSMVAWDLARKSTLRANKRAQARYHGEGDVVSVFYRHIRFLR